MEFKDRVANKPNRVKLTYEDGGASAYATVELADEPIEEGTPLNAENMNKLLNKENNDYIVEQGTSGIWTYRKWESGIAECWGNWREEDIAITTASRGSYTSAVMTKTLPFVLYNASHSGHVSNNMWFGNTWVSGGTNTLYYSIARVTSAASDSCDIRMFIIGRWK